MNEKVLDIKIQKNIQILKRLLNNEKGLLQKTYQKKWAEWEIKTSWVQNRLFIESRKFRVKGYIDLLPGKVEAVLTDLPFFLYPQKRKYINMFKPLIMNALYEKGSVTARKQNNKIKPAWKEEI